MADELDKASEVSTNADFNEFLKLQATALRKADPMLDAYADKNGQLFKIPHWNSLSPEKTTKMK